VFRICQGRLGPRARRATTGGIVVCAIVTAGGMSTAQAHHGHPSMYPTPQYNVSCFDGVQTNGVICRTDNADVTVYRESSLDNQAGREQIGGVLDREFRPTDLDVTFTAPVYTGESETDIIYRRRDVAGTAVAITFCDDAVTSLKCDQHYVSFENALPGEFAACHESGHAVGLLHPAWANPPQDNFNSTYRCMTQPASANNLGTHNVSQINAAY
jgi:hypothetical protein